MNECESHVDVVRLWPTVIEFAKAVGITTHNAKIMVHRGKIPAKHLRAVAEAAARDGFAGITYARLVELAKQP